MFIKVRALFFKRFGHMLYSLINSYTKTAFSKLYRKFWNEYNE